MVTTTGFIRCLCKHKYGDNSNCPRHGSLMSRTSPPPSSPSYTLAELRSSMEEFLTDMQHRGHAATYGPQSLTDWKFETYLQWLAKREQGR